jgi:hypothetical protein
MKKLLFAVLIVILASAAQAAYLIGDEACTSSADISGWDVTGIPTDYCMAWDRGCSEEHRNATMLLNFVENTKLSIRHLDTGINDGFDIFVGGFWIDRYEANARGWVTTEICVPHHIVKNNGAGWYEVNIGSSGEPIETCTATGQLAVEYIHTDGTCAEIPEFGIMGIFLIIAIAGLYLHYR